MAVPASLMKIEDAEFLHVDRPHSQSVGCIIDPCRILMHPFLVSEAHWSEQGGFVEVQQRLLRRMLHSARSDKWRNVSIKKARAGARQQRLSEREFQPVRTADKFQLPFLRLRRGKMRRNGCVQR